MLYGLNVRHMISVYRIVYGKAYQFIIEVELKTYWAFKTVKLDLNFVGPLQKLQINELEKLRLDAVITHIFLRKR